MQGHKTFAFDFGDEIVQICAAAGVISWTGVNSSQFTRVTSGADISITWNSGDGGGSDYAHATVLERNSQGHVTRATIDLDPAFEQIRYDCGLIQRLLVHEMGHLFGFHHVPNPDYSRVGVTQHK